MRRGGARDGRCGCFFFRALFQRFIAALFSLTLLPPTRPSLLLNDEDVPLTPCSHFVSLRNTLVCPLDDRKSATYPHAQTDSIDIVFTFSPAYFNIKQPQTGTQWQNGAANPAQWTKGLMDDVPRFDIEIGRLSVDGILFVATDGLSPFIHPFLFLPH